MALKLKLKTLDGIDDSIKSLYKEIGGEFSLDLDGQDDTLLSKDKEIEAILKKNQELLDELKTSKRDRKDFEEKQKKDTEEKNQKDGNFEALYKSAMEQIEGKDTRIKEMIAKNNSSLIDSTVIAMASKLCDGANISLIKPHIQRRLGIDEKGGIQILNSSGEPTVLTQEDLVKEYQSNKDFSPIIRGTKSSGGGATGGSSSGAGVPDTSKMTSMEKLIEFRENPDSFEK